MHHFSQIAAYIEAKRLANLNGRTYWVMGINRHWWIFQNCPIPVVSADLNLGVGLEEPDVYRIQPE